MMIAARGDERRLVAEALHQLEPEYTAIKLERAIEIGDLEMHVANAHTGINWRGSRPTFRSDFGFNSHDPALFIVTLK